MIKWPPGCPKMTGRVVGCAEYGCRSSNQTERCSGKKSAVQRNGREQMQREGKGEEAGGAGVGGRIDMEAVPAHQRDGGCRQVQVQEGARVVPGWGACRHDRG